MPISFTGTTSCKRWLDKQCMKSHFKSWLLPGSFVFSISYPTNFPKSLPFSDTFTVVLVCMTIRTTSRSSTAAQFPVGAISYWLYKQKLLRGSFPLSAHTSCEYHGPPKQTGQWICAILILCPVLVSHQLRLEGDRRGGWVLVTKGGICQLSSWCWVVSFFPLLAGAQGMRLSRKPNLGYVFVCRWWCNI